MLDKLEAIKARFDQVGVALTNPEIINNQAEFGKMSKEYRSLEKIVQPYLRYVKVLADYQFAKDSLNGDDADMRELAKMELPELETEKDHLEKELTKLLIPKDPQDDKNAIIELRAGTGGDEASLFVGDLLTMYTRYCQKKGWKVAVASESEGTVGGYKEVILEVTGEDVYGTMKFESGVHRVQRVPSTETQGRVHTSAATVAVAATPPTARTPHAVSCDATTTAIINLANEEICIWYFLKVLVKKLIEQDVIDAIA